MSKIKESKNIKILFLDIYTDDEKFRKNIEKLLYGGGNYSEHVRKLFGLSKNQWLTLDASRGKFPAMFPEVNAMIIGGSTEDPVKGKEKEWMKKTYKFISKGIKKQIPILGICGGLQFVVRALGGEIIYNPKGKEFGATKIFILKPDPLFKGLRGNFIAPSNHRCMIGKFKFKGKLLASSKMCRVQALAIGDKIRLVQFHPERTKEQNLALAKISKDNLVKDGIINSMGDYPEFLKSLKVGSRAGKMIIKNFLDNFVFYPN